MDERSIYSGPSWASSCCCLESEFQCLCYQTESSQGWSLIMQNFLFFSSEKPTLKHFPFFLDFYYFYKKALKIIKIIKTRLLMCCMYFSFDSFYAIPSTYFESIDPKDALALFFQQSSNKKAWYQYSKVPHNLIWSWLIEMSRQNEQNRDPGKDNRVHFGF